MSRVQPRSCRLCRVGATHRLPTRRPVASCSKRSVTFAASFSVNVNVVPVTVFDRRAMVAARRATRQRDADWRRPEIDGAAFAGGFVVVTVGAVAVIAALVAAALP